MSGELFDLGFGAIRIWPGKGDGAPRIRYSGNYSGTADLPGEVIDLWLGVARGDRPFGDDECGDFGSFFVRWTNVMGEECLHIECNPRGLYYGLCVKGNIRSKDIERFISTLEACEARRG